ncbi:MAG: hypothetical protein QJR02_09680 [Sinobacteraceae bacterium]|nr:hypothetical protein [Nevskia sp.]MDI3259952.1 hypothetical protein [Nevskiaceae bacterium]
MWANKSLGFKCFGASALLAVCAAAVAQPMANDEYDTTPSATAMAADLVVLRPLSLAGTVLGTVVFIAGLPFEAISGDVSGPARRLVLEPAEFTFTRPLGEAH